MGMMLRKTCWGLVGVAACLGLLQGCAQLSRVSVESGFAPGGPMRLAVLDFDWDAPTGQMAQGDTIVNMPNAGKFVADSFSSRLLEVSGFEVLERSKIFQLLAEKALSQSELIKQGRYQEIGKFLGVDYLVLGTVNSYTTWASKPFAGYVVSFTSRCVEVKTSKVVWAFSGRDDMGPLGPMDAAVGLQRILDDGIPRLKQAMAKSRRGT